MHQQPLLSIILTFRNQREVIEPTLSALFEMKSVLFELFVMEDASTDGSNDAIQSLLDYYQHDQTYYFEHAQPAGRGNCLNEALQQCNGSAVWIPRTIKHIDEALLGDAVHQLHESDFAFFCDVDSLPFSPEHWIDFIRGRTWPDDGDFLWNLNRIPSSQQFFNPYSESYHALELAARLGASVSAGQIESWHKPGGQESLPDITYRGRSEVAYTLLRRQDLTTGHRRSIFSLLNEREEAEPVQTPGSETDKLLNEATQMRQEGRFNAALELVEHVLAEEPDHRQAKQLKIDILERKQRFVEASELKHEMNVSKKSAPQETSADDKIKTSIIIPTALYGKPALEHCLVSVGEYCNPKTTELIVIDNASLDDTHDYLEELQSKHFFRCKVITNKANAGFSASVNQGLEMAGGQYACIMHNDVELTSDVVHQLEQLLDAQPEFALAGPLTGKTLNPDQSLNQRKNRSEGLVSAEYLDSFCLMVRMDANLRMDETYQLAFFEDIDLCFQARKQGLKVGIATGITVEHHFGTTTFALNLDTESEEYWKNTSYFNKKWNVKVLSEEELNAKSSFDQLLALDTVVNPVYPEENIKARFEQLFTDEIKTEILKSDHEPEVLCQLVHLMMVMEQREVMRRLEDKSENIELPASLIYRLVRFYFSRNIYSRCIHYLDKLKSDQQSLLSELYRLEILVNEKELETAVPKLKELLEKAPSNPTLYKLAGDIHQFEGNEEEAASFYQIACQINPFEYSSEGTEELRL